MKASLTAVGGSVFEPKFCCRYDYGCYIRTLMVSCVAPDGAPCDTGGKFPSHTIRPPGRPVCWYSGSTNTVSKCREIRIDRQRLNSPPVSLALSPVSINRRIVSPTTRPTPASWMHGWPAVADLTSGRPIRIALFQVGATPKAPAHIKLFQHISQRSDPFLCSLKPRGAQIG